MDEGLSASRFAEYLSHEHKVQPYAWERLLVDAAVIGGKDRWERRLSGLAQELRERLALSEDNNARERIERQVDRLDELRAFALPLLDQLDALRPPRSWGEWLDALRPLAEAALDDPEGLLLLPALSGQDIDHSPWRCYQVHPPDSAQEIREAACEAALSLAWYGG